MAITEYYISVAGGGANDGTSEANAWTLSQAITANNALGAGGAAGRRYNVKVGAYTARGATDTISVGGTATSPAIWRGYNSTIGDLDNGTRDQYGALDTTSFPDIGYSATYGIDIGGDHIVFANIDISGARSARIVQLNGQYVQIINCRVSNTSTNASALCLNMGATTQSLVNCDFQLGASGGTAAVSFDSAEGEIHGCRFNAPGCIGIRVAQSILAVISNCTIFGCGTSGIEATATGASLKVLDCTIQGCVDGIKLAASSTSLRHRIIGNSITDNSGWGINFNGAGSGAICVTAGNRFRDNASGNTTGLADWTTGTSFRNITTDTGGAATDYTDATTNKDFSLIYDAPGNAQGFGHKSAIGACGLNAPTPATVATAVWAYANRTLTA